MSQENLDTSHAKENAEIISGDYFVLDEAHYFLADSSFNTEIEKSFSIMETLMAPKRGKVWIYMTATIPYLLLQLSSSEPVVIPYLDKLIGFNKEFYDLHGMKIGYDFEGYFNSVKALLMYKEESDDQINQYLWEQERRRENYEPEMIPFAEYYHLQNCFSEKSKSIDVEFHKTFCNFQP